jgi:two-component system response regulator MprA
MTRSDWHERTLDRPMQHEPKIRILVVEDAPNVGRLLHHGLSHEGYRVQLVTDGHAALSAVRDFPPDLVVLDLTLPDIDGIEICKRIRAGDAAVDQLPVPILMLTGRDGIGDRVAGLDAGADDYLIKPFELDELVARTRALLRRRTALTTARFGSPEITFGDLTIDLPARTVRRGTRELQLSTREFDLLVFFVQRPNLVLTQDEIMHEVWGDEFFGESNVLAVVVGSLRRELEAGDEPRIIQTVRGVGYVLRPDRERIEAD